MAFASDSTGQYEIYIRNFFDGSLRKITENSSTDRYPAISPDGKWLCFASNRTGIYQLYKIHIDSSEVNGNVPLQLTFGTSEATEPDWSPKNWNQTYGQAICFRMNNNIYFVPANGSGNVFQVTNNLNNFHPVWDKDGGYIYNTHGHWVTNYGKYVYNLYATTLLYGPLASLTSYTTNYQDVLMSTQSKNGDMAYVLLVSNTSPNRYEIWNFAGTNIVNWLKQVSDIEYAPEGDTIYFCGKDVNDDFEIYKKKADGTGSTIKITDNLYNEIDIDLGLSYDDYQIIDIYPVPYTVIKKHKPDVSYTFIGNGYLWNTLLINWMQYENFNNMSSGVFYNANTNEVVFKPNTAGAVNAAVYLNDTIWFGTQLIADTGSGLVTVDSMWYYIYNPAPSKLDSMINASKKYSKKMYDLYLKAEDGKARVKMANCISNSATLFIQPMATGSSFGEFVLSGIDYVAWNDTGGVALGEMTGIPLGLDNALFNNLESALDIMSSHLRTEAEALYSDPPDTNYTVLPCWNGLPELTTHPPTDDSLPIFLYLIEHYMGMQTELTKLFTSALEKYQGTVIDENNYYMLYQLKNMKQLTKNLSENAQLLTSSLQWVVDSVKGGIYDRYLDVFYLNAVKSRLQSHGISSHERNNLLNAGFTPSQIDSVVNKLLSIDISNLQNQWLSDIYDSLKVNFSEGIPLFETFSVKIQEMIDSLQALMPDSFPLAVAGGPYVCNEGQSIVLSAAGSTDPNNLSLTYAWEIDTISQGSFVTGNSTENIQIAEQGIYPVVLRVTNSAGYSAYDYTWIVVKNTNMMPVVTYLQPDSSFIIIAPNTTINFIVSAQDSDGSKTNLVYNWYRDSVFVSSDTTYSCLFTGLDTLLVHIKVNISDMNLQSYDMVKDWWVRTGVFTVNNEMDDKNMPEHSSVTIFPNPFSDILSLVFSAQENFNADIFVYDLTGRAVLHEKKPVYAGITSISISTVILEEGFYIIEVNTVKGILTKKLLLVR
ncbi:MAG: translocation protein TolB [Bacteroidetes bacterium ADurb.Bin408]|nr:MAG: translocation protein TolB [Bacteroidetes bacterium ADurb.Bin408]